MQIRIERRRSVPTWMVIISTVVGVAIALLFGALLLSWGGISPLVAYRAMLNVGFLESYSFSDTLVKATPLILAGLAVTVAFRMKLWNIGAEGQLQMGAWAATGVALFWLPPETPKAVMLTGMIVAGMVAGGIWGWIPGILKARLNVNEIITSLMLVYVALLWNSYFVFGPWSAGGFGLTAPYPRTAWFPRLLDLADQFPEVRGMTVHLGVILAIIVAVILYILFRVGKWGYILNVIGDNPVVARYAGMNISRMIVTTFVISGAIAGLAGVSEVAGAVHRLGDNFSPGYGFTAIIVAWLARLNPIAVVIVGYLFGGLLVGGDAIQPAGISLMIQGIVLFCVISADLLTRYRLIIERSPEAISEKEAAHVGD
ncbi:MAG: ABC transporter permease [Anaerolineales bacterium]|nr:ABC transporter permease [Anaerolineales bacterium]